jgi:hypothetical protein
VEFYRRLGIDIPEGSESQQHVPVKMGEMIFFLNTKPERKVGPAELKRRAATALF